MHNSSSPLYDTRQKLEKYTSSFCKSQSCRNKWCKHEHFENALLEMLCIRSCRHEDNTSQPSMHCHTLSTCTPLDIQRTRKQQFTALNKMRVCHEVHIFLLKTQLLRKSTKLVLDFMYTSGYNETEFQLIDINLP
jgi:hypothetical protein